MNPKPRYVIVALLVVALMLGIFSQTSQTSAPADQPVATAGWNNGFDGLRRFFIFFHRLLRSLIEEEPGNGDGSGDAGADDGDGGGDSDGLGDDGDDGGGDGAGGGDGPDGGGGDGGGDGAGGGDGEDGGGGSE